MAEDFICPYNVLGGATLCNDGYVRNDTVSRTERCRGWIPAQSHYYVCSLPVKFRNPGDCRHDDILHAFITCDGCQYYKRVDCKPIPAHCLLLGQKGGL